LANCRCRSADTAVENPHASRRGKRTTGCTAPRGRLQQREETKRVSARPL
jgi:hypothetical protein